MKVPTDPRLPNEPERLIVRLYDLLRDFARTINDHDERIILRGAGSPEGAITAGVGRLYVDTGGGASTTLYVKTSGTGNTGWTAK